ncbi:PPP4R2-domain-containing protein [Pterulicium gracile]|uniref:PPP4R2-domain-containing protein n=1 Tax=Pterulicium gracile TaxID=1884261 RepID=A0A5C3R7L8_9AGAR|nr:PPP4R2-domain-containing protein [Pterula gracilis]
MSAYSISSDFTWDQDYDAILDQIASTDIVDSEWTKLRDIIKFKIQQNIDDYLAKPPPGPPTNLITSPKLSESGSLTLPPFPPRRGNPLTLPELPANHMTREQADEMKDNIFEQLHSFDASPPFTIQRICELVLRPTQVYNSVGKYLRAVEKSVLVTSTWDAFPPLSEAEKRPYLTALVGISSPVPSSAVSSPSSSVFPPLDSPPSTPLFSPIPFLHEDARRSKSRSPPPPSPLSLAGTAGTNEIPSLGLVDELDDPTGPEHMSTHPTALTSTTTSEVDGGQSGSPVKTKTSQPFLGSLRQRFVSAGPREAENESAGGLEVTEDVDMDLDDEHDDKENKATELTVKPPGPP